MQPISRFLKSVQGRFVAGLTALMTLAWLNGARFTGVIDWEPTIAFVLASVAWVYSCFPEAATTEAVETEQPSQTPATEHDKQLFSRFRNQLSENERAFLRDHDFGGVFALSSIEGLRRISATWRGAEFEFDDTELQKKFSPIVDHIRQLSSDIGLNTQMVGTEHAKVPYSHEREAQSRAISDKLNADASTLVGALDDFIRSARKRIG